MQIAFLHTVGPFGESDVFVRGKSRDETLVSAPKKPVYSSAHKN